MTKSEARAIIRSYKGDPGDAGAVWTRLESLEVFRQADSVLLYWSMPSELPTHAFIRRWEAAKQILLPRVEPDGRLSLRRYSPETMVPGYRGIGEPSADAPEGTPALIVVPGLAFDAAGRRLGRGGGYYDRLLAGQTVPKVGVCYDFQLLEEVPVEAWDERVDIVIAPSNMYICKI